MPDKIRIGILGHGFIGSVHREALFGLEDYEVICIADPAIKTDKIGKAKAYRNYCELLEKESKNLDAVINALPTTLHLQSTKDAAECGLHLLLEKPMGINADEAKQIKDNTAKVKLMVGMTGRYHPEFVAAHNHLDKIGDLIYMNERIHCGGTPFPRQYLDKKTMWTGNWIN